MKNSIDTCKCEYIIEFFQTAVCTASEPDTEREIPGTAHSRQRTGGRFTERKRERDI